MAEQDDIFIRISTRKLLTQLADEATELAKYALLLRDATCGKHEATENLLESAANVIFYIDLLGDYAHNRINRTCLFKIEALMKVASIINKREGGTT